MKTSSVSNEKKKGNDGKSRHSNGNAAKVPVDRSAPAPLTRRNFLGSVGGVATLAIAAGSIPLEPLFDEKHSVVGAAVVDYQPAARAAASRNYRTSTAKDEHINVGVQPDNGDTLSFTDFSGSFSKGLQHDGLGVPNAASWLSLKYALQSGRHADDVEIFVDTPGGGHTAKVKGAY